jgi:molybdenum cofactor cytidylyltransferase
MRFGPAPLDEAEGAILAHSQRVGERMIRKGSLLDADMVGAMRDAGMTEVICAQLEPGDVPEDIAADRLATPLVSPLIARSRAATGRVNLSAEVPGLLRVDAMTIDRLNTIDEALTIGTLPDYAVVARKDLVATVKIVPLSIAGKVLSVAEAIVRQGGSPIRLHPFQHLKVGLVVTQLPGLKDSVTDKTIAVTEQRVTALTGSLLPPVRCHHDEESVAKALDKLLADGADMLLIIGASAVVDRRDVGPAGIVRAGGDILHFGMPVDPGNLICVGRLHDKPALVLPGCARSPVLNGIDFVLSRLFAGIKVTPTDIMRMGVGGLLLETETRPLPREKAPATERSGAAPRTAPAAWRRTTSCWSPTRPASP